MLVVSMRRAQLWTVAAALFMLAGFGAFLGQLRAVDLQPGDFLHTGIAAALVLYSRWCARIVLR